MKSLWLTAAALCALNSAPAFAQTITSYDITGADTSGFGGWSYNYSGTITGTNYIGGAGTLNDGVIPNTQNNNHLFQLQRSPTITAYLDGFYTLSSISILSNYFNNGIPGNITGFSVTTGAISQFYSTTGFGGTGSSGFPVNELATLSGPGSALAVDRFTLSGFTTAGNFPEFFAIGELNVNGTAAIVNGAVPEPATWAMMILGFGFVGGTMRTARRRQKLALSYA